MIASLSDACVEMDPAVISIPHGDSDSMRVAHAERIHESIENPEPVVVEGSGHWIFVDATDRFRPSVFDFLSRVVGRSAGCGSV